MKDQLYDQLRTILRSKAKLEQRPGRIVAVYTDGKISIEGLWPFDYYDESSEPYEQIGVAIKLANTSNRAPFPMSLSSSEDETPVYYWSRNIRHYFRPGRWQTYVSNLVSDIKQEAEESTRLDNSPIDDSSLFPSL